MFFKLMTYTADMMARLRSEEDGLALTEYLILLGLLTSAVIIAVTLFGTQLGVQWGTWGAWMRDAALAAPPT